MEYCNSDQSEIYGSFILQLITKSIIEVGKVFLEKRRELDNVRNTIEAAEHYLMNPTATNYDFYSSVATNSYPFGDGEGCHSLYSDDCKPGTGCESGSGSLKGMFEDQKVLSILSKEVIPWIKRFEKIKSS